MKNAIIFMFAVGIIGSMVYLCLPGLTTEKNPVVSIDYGATTMHQDGLNIYFEKPRRDRIIPVYFNQDQDSVQYSHLIDVLYDEIPIRIIYKGYIYNTEGYSPREWYEFIKYNLEVRR